MTFKEIVHNTCIEVLNTKIASVKATLNDLRESASNETKSTAGDKHETALAMLQIEQENTNRQLESFLLQKLILQKINPSVRCIQVANGALVKTDKGYLFVSIALGKLIVEGTSVIAISPQSPLGAKLMGLCKGDSVSVNQVTYNIEKVE